MGDGLSFRRVGVQQARSGPPAENSRQFPAQIVHVGDARVHTQAADDGERVRGIPGQQDPAVPEALGDEGVHHPVLDPQHVGPHGGAGAEGARDEIGPVGAVRVLGRGSEPGPAPSG